MQIGLLTRFDQNRIEFAQLHGFGCIELLVADNDPFIKTNKSLNHNWSDEADRIFNSLSIAGLRLSCIGGFYSNNLDPAQSEKAASYIKSVIDLAEYLQVDRVAGFAGRWPLNMPCEDSLPAFQMFWQPLAKYAADKGVKIAFEHCPMGTHHLPPGGINIACTPAMWERMFDYSWADNLGIEWDASHLICQRIDPVLNILKYGDRIFHVHAKDARVEKHIYNQYGIYHPGAIEHCFPGLGDADWPAIVKSLYRVGYDSDLNIEGWHDHVYNDHDSKHLENTGLLIGLQTLKPLVDNL